MSFETDAHIKALTKAFRACTLPKERWTHAAHWAGALCLLSEDEHAGNDPRLQRICRRPEHRL